MTSTMSAYEDPDASLYTRQSYAVSVPQPAYEELDASEPFYEDLDALMPAVTGQPEVQSKPVPRPRSKVLLAAPCINDHGAGDSEDKTNEITQNAEVPPDYKRPLPVRRPPEPPVSKYLSSNTPQATENQYTSSQPRVKPPAVCSQRTPDPPSRPERPPLPIYYGRITSHKGETGPQPKECEPATRSSTSSNLELPPSFPPEEGLKLNGTYADTGTEKKPVVPPRPRQPSPLRQTPPPPLSRPPSLVKEPDEAPYLEILPSETTATQRRSTLRPEPTRLSQRSQSKEDTEEVLSMLRWLKKVSRSDYMMPSVYGLSLEEEIRSFELRAANVSKALRLFNILMMKRNDKMRTILAEFTSISDGVDKLQKKNKTMGIAGGTAGAVGGVTAVVGIALAPVTLGASLIATAVGAGMVASAGGMGAHTAKANKKIVSRCTVEKLVSDYEANVVELEHCLEFIVCGMNELRRHDLARLQRAGAQLEAVRTAHLSQSVFNSANSNAAGTSSHKLLLSFSKEMDQYFTEKDNQKLKKLNKSKFSGRVRLLAQNLQDDLDHMNYMWEQFT
ncbi:uncharacterized protein LOC114860198 isoform X2 [Betta splendens]|uniref:Uncharacterized protein LOC114860198 isoform X2 n=1 Tax=Betta splendens TaxID=158456 RepID=A0A6P7N597_BETSP|nr:uncharacterized protein LOC114860198 isoform X2 [Betta splendens]